MGWNFTPVEGKKTYKITDADITAEERKDFAEAVDYSLAHNGERMVLTFTDADTRDMDRAKLRFLTNTREGADVVASVWDKSTEKTKDKAATFVLSVAWSPKPAKTEAE